jgi:uridine kinase
VTEKTKTEKTMKEYTERIKRTRALLIKHYKSYPELRTEDVFKFLFQSSFGCEHLVSNADAVLDYIKREYETVDRSALPYTDPLDGDYTRVYLSYLNDGLSPETLARTFFLSAKKEENGRALLEEKLSVVSELVDGGDLPLDAETFNGRLNEWRDRGYPAIHHSSSFRDTYRPAYRVIANRYADFMQIFCAIDKLLANGNVTVAIEGGSASGKSTLSEILSELYDCNVFHMDDFFLRHEQRTPERFAEVGGNVDRERFYDEVLRPLNTGNEICYRRFDCSTQTLSAPITVQPKRLTVVEGVYSMHTAFSRYYDLGVFLDIDSQYQKRRILVRNSPQFANRFFNEWIPLENRYFEKTAITERSNIIIHVNDEI